MSLIEKAVERLERLKQAAGDPAPDSGVQPPPYAKESERPKEVQTQADSSETAQPVGERLPATHGQAAPTVSVLVGEVPANNQQLGNEESSAAQLKMTESEVAPGHLGTRFVDIDLQRLADMHMVTPDRSNSRVAEQFRVIKRPLIQNAKGLGAAPVKDGNLIMVTSSLPGEGKSFTAINLAISMAMELDYKVLLVDADFSKPSVLRYLGLPQQRGLMDVLTGEVGDLADVMLRTSIEKLTLLPAGFAHPRATELIASEAMGRMLKELSQRYSDRIVVFDSPPLIPTTEARVLAARVGQIVMVVEADRTSQAAVKAALGTIESCPVKLMLLNKTVVQASNDFYGYGGYGYGYGADAKTEAVS